MRAIKEQILEAAGEPVRTVVGFGVGIAHGSGSSDDNFLAGLQIDASVGPGGITF